MGEIHEGNPVSFRIKTLDNDCNSCSVTFKVILAHQLGSRPIHQRVDMRRSSISWWQLTRVILFDFCCCSGVIGEQLQVFPEYRNENDQEALRTFSIKLQDDEVHHCLRGFSDFYQHRIKVTRSSGKTLSKMDVCKLPELEQEVTNILNDFDSLQTYISIMC